MGMKDKTKKPRKVGERRMRSLTRRVLKHWRRNVILSEEAKETGCEVKLWSTVNGGFSKRGEDCAYCNVFVHDQNISNKDHCIGCPIRLDTGRVGCNRTPWLSADAWKPKTIWTEYMYLLNVAYSQGLQPTLKEQNG